GMGKRGEGIDTSSFYSSGYARDRSKVKVAALWGSFGSFAAQQPKPNDDLCVAPPSSIRPSLPAKLLPGQGRAHLAIATRSAKAQEFFDQGLAQMHSFWAREAERSFLKAAALDPEAPMPQWGISMVAAGDYRPGFQLMDEDGKIRKQSAPKPDKS